MLSRSETSPGELPVWAELSAAAPPAAYFAAWLAYQCESMDGVLGAVIVLGAPDAGPFAPLAFWPDRAAGAGRAGGAREPGPGPAAGL